MGIKVLSNFGTALGGIFSADSVIRWRIPLCQRYSRFPVELGQLMAANWPSTTQEKFHGGERSGKNVNSIVLSFQIKKFVIDYKEIF